MTTPRRDPEALLSAYLAVGMEALPDRVVGAVLDEAHRTRQRTVIGPWRTRPMSRATFAAAAVVALLALGAALLVVGGGPSPAPSEEPSRSLPAIVAPSSTPSGPSAAPTASPVISAAGLWIATGKMGSPRSEHDAVRLLDGRVLVPGGSRGHQWLAGTSDGGTDLTSAELYDPVSGTWSATGNMLKPRCLPCVDRGGFPPTLLLDGKVLVGDVDDPAAETISAEVYDPESGTWTATGKMVDTRVVGQGGPSTATVLRDGKVLVAGESGAQVYDPDSGTWSATGKMITQRHAHIATLLRDGKVLVAGGSDGGDVPVYSVELYDPGTGYWTAIANPHRDGPRCVGCPGGDGWATLLQDGTLLLLRPSDEFAEIYDPATGTWTVLAEPTEFSYRTATLLSDGTVLAAGFFSRRDGPQPCTTAALYDPRTGSWTTTSSMLRCGNDSSFTLLLDGTVLVAGGSDCQDGICVATGAAELFVPAGVSPPPLPGFPSPPPPIFPSPTPVPTPFPPAAGPVPPNARSWKVTVDNKSSEPATLFVAEWDLSGVFRLVGSATPNVVPAGATVKVTFLFPAKGDPDGGWIFVNPRPGDEGGLIAPEDFGIPGKIVITAECGCWLSP